MTLTENISLKLVPAALLLIFAAIFTIAFLHLLSTWLRSATSRTTGIKFCKQHRQTTESLSKFSSAAYYPSITYFRMNRVSLDRIGIAGFAYDFESLSGRPSRVVSAFETFGSSSIHHFVTDMAMLLAPVFPPLLEILARARPPSEISQGS
ncbi:hypothetical protein D9615_009615 [Tricholomella constricta]|uniref:Uncharacterized protein n=1 Tax=Tricholomella constricta TaxID=117010 RepID=A0A8H5GUW5_9AGAR|nr:hypothetical protein D9615_009615 [Tricholomella constricta]